MKILLIRLITIYQRAFSFLFGRNCRFYPTCSEYAKKSILNLGVGKGFFCSLKRILKCHPLHPGGYDPAPNKRQ